MCCSQISDSCDDQQAEIIKQEDIGKAYQQVDESHIWQTQNDQAVLFRFIQQMLIIIQLYGVILTLMIAEKFRCKTITEVSVLGYQIPLVIFGIGITLDQPFLMQYFIKQ